MWEPAVERSATPASTQTITVDRLARSLDASLIDVAEDVVADSDPVLQVRFHHKSGKIKLSHEQRELLWEARKDLYSKVFHKFNIVLTSHLNDKDKCHQLLALHDVAISKRLRLTDVTYDSIFHTFLMGIGDLGGREAPLLDLIWRVYRYMIDSGTDPTPKVIQHVMMLLERVRMRNIEVEAKAHALMLDSDRFKLMPTEYTLTAYFSICAANECMHLAVARYTDARTRLQMAPTPSMCATIIRGLLKSGQNEEAMQFVQSLDSVAITDHLLNAVLQAARLSPDPSSVFTIFRSIRGSGLPPSFETISILLEVCFDTGSYSEVPYILHLMKKYGVRGDERYSNKLLVALWRHGNPALAHRFQASMEKHGVRVYYERVAEEKAAAKLRAAGS